MRVAPLGHTIHGEFPGSLTYRSMVISFSQGLRDGMNCPGCDEDSTHIDSACLAERHKNAGRENGVGGAGLSRTPQERCKNGRTSAGRRAIGGDDNNEYRVASRRPRSLVYDAGSGDAIPICLRSGPPCPDRGIAAKTKSNELPSKLRQHHRTSHFRAISPAHPTAGLPGKARRCHRMSHCRAISQ
jgi:hypothetical protein